MGAKIVRVSVVYLFLTLFSSCCTPCHLSVQSLFITHEDLASTIVYTPDPRKECPDIGQKLIVRWSLCSEQTMENEETLLLLKIRYGTGEERQILHEIHSSSGRMIYELLNEEYQELCGILAYKAEIIQNGSVINEWTHQVWTERICF